MDVKRIAEKIIKRYCSRNPFDIVSQMNVILIKYPLHGVRGFYQYFQRNNLIYINENLSHHEQCFVCAHEIGHMVLHKKSNAIFMDSRTFLSSSRYEREANRFAMDLLVADNVLEENLELNYEQLSRLLGYERALIELRIKDFN